MPGRLIITIAGLTLTGCEAALGSSSVDDGQATAFHGYECSEDCSGHEAGYEWAQEHHIEDPEMCDGKSKSFIEGCRAYAQEVEDYEARFEDSHR